MKRIRESPPAVCLKMFSEVIKLTNTRYKKLAYLSLLTLDHRNF